jgi:hypothetical protein
LGIISFSAKIHNQVQLVSGVSSCPLAQKHAQKVQHQANALSLAFDDPAGVIVVASVLSG